MPTRQCTVEGCDRKHYAKGMCSVHWQRVTHPPGKCSVEGCDRPLLAKSYCSLHYHRWQNRGDPGGVEVERIRDRKCSVDGCGRRHAGKGLCHLHRGRLKRTGEIGPADVLIGKWPGTITSQGYRLLHRPGHPNAWGKGTILEHTLVMSETLGRPLRKGETVHHKNGDRADNRPENLELWSGAQPSGQRVTDKILYAVEILRRYVPDPTLWPEEWHGFRETIADLFIPLEE